MTKEKQRIVIAEDYTTLREGPQMLISAGAHIARSPRERDFFE